MTDQLLDHYKEELSFILRMGEEFSRNHPEVAEGLGLGAASVQDPHVERLIKAFALLTARIRRKLDDDFPELSQSLLNILNPNYLAPVPSCSLAQLELDRGASEPYPVPRGTTVQTEPVGGEPCFFRTAYETLLWPVTVDRCEFLDGPEKLLKFELVTFDESILLGELSGGERPLDIRFFLYDHAPYTDANALYEHLLNDVVIIQLQCLDEDRESVFELRPEIFQPVGFDPEDSLLPEESHTLSPFSVLRDYFAFPPKYRFVDLCLPEEIARECGHRLRFTITLNRGTPTLERNFSPESLRLGCTPIVNQFRPSAASQIRLDQTRSEYRVVPDPRRPKALEIFRILKVVEADTGQEYDPLFFVKHSYSAKAKAKPLFYTSQRRPARMSHDLAEMAKQHDEVDRGTEVYLSLVDLDLNPATATERTLHVETECLNRDLPGKLQFGGGKPRLSLPDGGPIAAVRCLEKPTPTRRPDLGQGLTWKLVAQLGLKHLPLADPEGRPDVLREILSLYDSVDSAEPRSRIESVTHVELSRTLAYLHEDVVSGYARGTRVDLRLDEERYSDRGLYLFASVLERFFALYGSINSFSQLRLRTDSRTVKVWQPRAATRPLL